MIAGSNRWIPVRYNSGIPKLLFVMDSNLNRSSEADGGDSLLGLFAPPSGNGLKTSEYPASNLDEVNQLKERTPALSKLFQPPTPPPPKPLSQSDSSGLDPQNSQRSHLERRFAETSSATGRKSFPNAPSSQTTASRGILETSPLISSSPGNPPQEMLYSSQMESPGKQPVTSEEITPKTSIKARKKPGSLRRLLPKINETSLGERDSPAVSKILRQSSRGVSLRKQVSETFSYVCKPSTWIGSFMFCLFQIVFSLTIGAAITRPHAKKPFLGVFTKIAGLGIVFGAPVYWIRLYDIPAMYPTVDLFTAPFLAQIAAQIDCDLHKMSLIHGMEEDEVDEIFLATFSVLLVLSLIISGVLLVLASVFKLANLGAFLPFPVLCGFFAAVGVLTWTLAFKVDNGGIGIGAVLFSDDTSLIWNSLLHHVPSVLVAMAMKYLGPKNPLYVVGVVFATIIAFYVIMFCGGISREEMIDAKWFWSDSDLVYGETSPATGFDAWQPPNPLGWVVSMLQGKVMWRAVLNGADTAAALGFLYLIRCSLHGAAMKKNIRNLERTTVTEPVPKRDQPIQESMPSPPKRRSAGHRRKFSEVLDIEQISLSIRATSAAPDASNQTVVIERVKPTDLSLPDILIQYGFSQFMCALVGGFPVMPAVNVSSTMYVVSTRAFLLFAHL